MGERKEGIFRFYGLAKYPTYEILMDSQIASAGAHQARLIEKFKKNKNYIKHQFLALKLVFSFLFVFLPIVPLAMYFDVILNPEEPLTINTVSFISSFIFGIYFGITFLYTLLFGMISTSSFMSGNSFKWLQTLPFSKKDLKRIGFLTLFRNLDIPLIILVISFPIIMVIGTQNILVFFSSLLLSFLNVMFSFSLLVLIGEKMSFIFSESKEKSKKVNLVRIVTMMSYFVIAFGSGMILSLGMNSIVQLVNRFIRNEPQVILNIVFSLIPYPFAPGYFLTISSIPNQVPIEMIFSTLVGFSVYALITYGLFRTAERALRSTVSTEIKIGKVVRKFEEVEVQIQPISPIKAYIRKDLVSSTRDIQSLMFFFFPIIYPLIMLLTLQYPLSLAVYTTEGILLLWSIIAGVYLFLPPMLIVGFLNIEESGSSTVASLPILPRDQAKAKLILMSIIQGISLTITSITLTIITGSILVLLLFIVTLPIAWTLLLLMFEMKIRLFGKMKYKYILEELHKENKAGKWIIMLVSLFGVYATIFLAGNILFYLSGIFTALIVLLIIGIIGLLSLIFVFTRMFPKVEKMGDYVTGGLLRERVNIGTGFLMLLFLVFLFLVAPIELILSPLLQNLNLLELLFIDFTIAFGLLALLWLVVVPLGLKLPKKESFNHYALTIGLSSYKPIWRNIVLGIGTLLIFGVSTVTLAIILGTYTFDLRILFGQPLTMFGFGWFLFIFMLRPGIWEEVAFRGVILNLQLKRYSQRTVIILNGVLFGLFHFVNLISGFDLYNTSMQVIYASCLGISFAYMYMKTKSLIPCIIAHYLIDAVGQLFLYVTFPNYLNSTIFLIFGIGVIPMTLTMILVKLVVRKDPLELHTFN